MIAQPKRGDGRSGDVRAKYIRWAHCLGKEIFGSYTVKDGDDEIPAYIYLTRRWAKIRFGVDKRRELPTSGWREMIKWLLRIKREKEARQ